MIKKIHTTTQNLIVESPHRKVNQSKDASKELYCEIAKKATHKPQPSQQHLPLYFILSQL